MCRRFATRRTHLATLAPWLLAALGCAAWTRPLQADAYHPQPGEWILDHARLYGLTVTNPLPEDARYVLLWMQAAAEVSPGLAEAWMWQYDLLSRLDRPDAALAALDNYCRAAPDDLATALERVAIHVDTAQTAEQRIEVCKELLAAGTLRPEVASDLHRRLAELLLNRLKLDDAAEQAHEALELFRHNLAARAVLAQARGKEAEPAEQVRLLLGQIAGSPASVDALFNLANLLDDLAMTADAMKWHQRAIDMFKLLRPAEQVPAELVMGLAWSHYDRGEDDEALALCQQVLQAQPTQPDALTLTILAARRAGHPEMADQQVHVLDDRYRKIEADAIKRRDATTCARIAWFHIDIDPDPQRAIRFAKLAVSFAPGDRLAQRVQGWAHLQLGELGDAIRILEPLADQDQWAALGLARAQHAAGNDQAARQALRTAESLRYCGRAYLKTIALLRDLGEDPAPKPEHPDVHEALAAFDARILDFPKDPSAAIDFTVAIDNAQAGYGQPIVGRFTLANKAPYPITLGVERMVAPEVAVSLRSTAAKGQQIENYLTVSLEHKLVMEPGDKVEVEQRLNTVPAQFLLDPEPQRRVEVEFSFVLAPQTDAEGKLTSSLAGLKFVTQRVVRRSVDATPAGLKGIYDALHSGSETERLVAIERVVALILERNEILAGRSSAYPALKVDTNYLTRLLIESLRDPTPVVRARALWAFTRLPLDRQVVSAAAPCLSDDNWLVRMWAEDLFAKKQGQVFLPVLEKFVDDANPLVAGLATLYRSHIARLMKATPRGAPMPPAP